MDNKGKPNLDENIVQNNTPKILTLSQSQLSKSLTVRYFSIFTFSGFLLVFGFMGIQTLANHITMKPSVVKMCTRDRYEEDGYDR